MTSPALRFSGMVTPERVCVGAFALWFMPRFPAIRIEVEDERGQRAQRAGIMSGRLLCVTVEHPWLGPDPRVAAGMVPDEQMAWDTVERRWVRRPGTRQPLRLATVLQVADTARPALMDQHAMIALLRFQRELARGYAIVGQQPPPPETFGHRKLLPQRAADAARRGAIAARYVGELAKLAGMPPLHDTTNPRRP